MSALQLTAALGAENQLIFWFEQFCRLEQSEEILAQWLYLSRKERQIHLQELAEKQESVERIAELNCELARIEAIIPAFIQRVNTNRKKNCTVSKKSEDQSDPIIDESHVPRDALKKLVAGDVLEGDLLINMREEHGFKTGKVFSKEQELRSLSLVRDIFPHWEHSMDAEIVTGEAAQPVTHVLEDTDKKSSSLQVEDLVYFTAKKVGYMAEDSTESGEEWSVIPLPSDRTICMVAKMYSSRGAWDSCLSVCTSMILQRRHELSLSSSATQSSSDVKREEVEGIEYSAERYSASVSSPLAVCYREALSALCSNSRFKAAFHLTRKVQEVGVIVTPSCIAMLLRMYEVNEDLSNARFRSEDQSGEDKEEDSDSGHPITLLDFQDDILHTILACSAFDGAMRSTVVSSSSSSSSSIIDDRSCREVQKQEQLDLLNSLSYEIPGVVESDHDQGSTGALITANIKLLCNRGTHMKPRVQLHSMK